MRYFPLLLVLSSGCFGSESFRIREPSCDVDFTRWTGGITHHMLEGPGDGSFDYDPAGNVERRIHGGYDLDSGDFSWDVEYAPAHYRTGTTVEGYGYAELNGDLDVLYTSTDTDVLGETTSILSRLEREGCAVSRTDRYLDSGGEGLYDQDHTGTYVDGGYEYEEVVEDGSSLWDVAGETSDDHTWTRTITQSTSDSDYAADEYGDFKDGTSRSDWVQDDRSQGVVFEGWVEQWMDGRKHRHYSYVSDGDTFTWDYTIDYRGNGSGTYEEPGMECEVEYLSFDCTLRCPGGQTYDCG